MRSDTFARATALIMIGVARLAGPIGGHDAPAVQPRPPVPVMTVARQVVAGDSTDRGDRDSPRVRAALRGLYEAGAAQSLWSTGGRPTTQALDAIAALEAASDKGLRPTDYDAAARRAEASALLNSTAPAPDAAPFDRALSRSVLRLIDHLHSGRIDPRSIGLDIPDSHSLLDLAALALEVSRSTDVRATLARTEPPYAGYAALARQLARYRALAADSGLGLPAHSRTTIRPGVAYADAPTLRRLLIAFGDLPATAPIATDSLDAEIYSGALVEAVVGFQRRHGLEPDGLIGQGTMTQLRAPIAARIRQIELTLERWRWLPDRAPARYVVVNVPAFRLALFEDDPTAQQPLLTMNVIVGGARARRHTPVFTGVMREIVFRPYWDVPPRIATTELLPLIRRQPSYFTREELEIVRGGDDDAVTYPPSAANLDRLAAGTLRLRQRPGPINALGLVKFVFPNRYNVYMHGTPAQQLFVKARRDFSHGCIRVEDPPALAAMVLRGQAAWSRSAIEAAMRGDRTIRVEIARPLTVYVLYGTAVVDEAGKMHFLGDLYGHDATLARALGLGPINAAR